jgi:hypothetical protein
MEPVFQAHPIPQNVTNFEFHLVGDMTLKQFGYLAAGLGFAFLVFTTLSTIQPIIAWPLIIISALLGVAFAFLPIQERPLDHWVAAFFKAIFQPTSLKYSSKIINAEDPLFSRRLGHYIKTYKYNEIRASAPLGNPNLLPKAFSSPTPATGPGTAPAMPQKKQNFIDKFKAGQTSFAVPQIQHPHQGAPQSTVKEQSQTLNSTLPTKPSPLPPVPSSSPSPLNAVPYTSPTPGILRNMNVISKLPLKPLSGTPLPQSQPQTSAPKQEPPKPGSTSEPADLKKTVELAREAQETQQEIVKIEASLSQIKQQAAQPGTDPKTYVEEFEDLLTELQKLNEKASKTAQQLAKVSNLPQKPLSPPIPSETAAVSETPAAPETIAQAPPPPKPPKAQSIPTLKLTSFPNIINGIVTDSQGNYIEGAIVVAHDRQGLPVRALKSNKLGQFVAATPLPNGEYSIVVEKESLSFDRVGIELNNEILPPILVAAKKIAAT